jgi:hypothetical protein
VSTDWISDDERLREHIFVLFAGDITQKGYEKKKAKLLAPYLNGKAQIQPPSKLLTLFSFVQRPNELTCSI